LFLITQVNTPIPPLYADLFQSRIACNYHEANYPFPQGTKADACFASKQQCDNSRNAVKLDIWYLNLRSSFVSTPGSIYILLTKKVQRKKLRLNQFQEQEQKAPAEADKKTRKE